MGSFNGFIQYAPNPLPLCDAVSTDYECLFSTVY